MNFIGLDLKSDRWSQFFGGYKIPYDPRPALLALERGENAENMWQELSTELYHQGDVGEASYAAVPHLVRIHELRGISDWNTYILIAMIEEGRQAPQNPELPADLKDAYGWAWRRMVHIGLRELESAEEPELVSCILAVIAVGKRQFQLGRFAMLFDEGERKTLLNDAGWP